MILGPPQSQSEMLLSGIDGFRRVPRGHGGITGSQSFFEIPKSIHEFSCQAFSPNGTLASGGVGGEGMKKSMIGYPQTVIDKKQDMTRSTNMLYPAKYSRVSDINDVSI